MFDEPNIQRCGTSQNSKKTDTNLQPETENIPQEMYLQEKNKKNDNFKNYFLSYDKKEKTTGIPKENNHIEAWENIATQYEEIGDTRRKRNMISLIIFQRLAIALSLIEIDTLQTHVHSYAKTKETSTNVTLHGFLIRSGALSKNIVDSLLSLSNPSNGQSLIPGYTIKEPLGEGGMGAVYLAKRIKDDQNVAIKIFAPPVSDVSTEISRFKQECELALKLESPYIVRSYECGDFYGMYYLVMEYIDGETLADYIEKNGRLDINYSIDVFYKILQAMWEAWNRNYIHRDIKPANIMIDKNGDVKLCDFGLAKALDSDEKITKTGAIMGTPQYMAPEQFSLNKIDYRVDVYSLGVTFYVMLTGELPFTAKSYFEISQAHMSEVPRNPTEINTKLPKHVAAFTFKLLSKRPLDRCDNPTHLLENFQRMQQGKLPKGGVSYFKQVRKRRLYKVITYSTIFAIAALIGSYILYIKFEERKQLAITKQQRETLEKRQLEIKKQEELQEKQHEQFLEEQKRKEQQLLEEQKRKEQQLLEEQKILEQKRQQQEKEQEKALMHQQMLQDIQLIKQNLLEMNSSLTKQQLKMFVKKYPNSSEIKALKSIIATFFTAISKTHKGELKKSFPYWKKTESNLSFAHVSQVIAKLFVRQRDKSKAKLLTLWLRLDKKSQHNLTDVLKEQESLNWLQNEFVNMSPKIAVTCLNYIAEVNSSYAEKLEVMRTLTVCFKNLPKSHATLNKHLQKPMYQQMFSETFTLLSSKQKAVFLKNIAFLFGKLSFTTSSFIFQQILKHETLEYQKNIMLNLSQINNKNMDSLFFNVAKDNKNDSLTTLAIKILYQHKSYDYLSAVLDTDHQDNQKFLLDLIDNNYNTTNEKLAVNALDSQFPDVKEKAIHILTQYNSTSVIPKLGRLIVQDKYISVKKKCVEALGELKSPMALETLIKSFEKNNNYTIGKLILDSIALKKSERAVSYLINLIVTERQYRSGATKALITMVPPEQIIPKIVDKVTHAEASDAILLIGILEDIGSKAVPETEKLLSETNQFYLKKALIKALGKIADPAAIDSLIRMLSDYRTKRYAVNSLEKIEEKLDDGDERRQKILKVLENSQ